MPDESEEKNRIKVTDRRQFTPEGELRRQEGSAPAEQDEPEPVRGEGFELKKEPPAGDDAGSRPMQAVDFNSFILSLSSTAFIYLGEMEDPSTKKREVNLEGARQMIDILDMLHGKTQGNLEAEEKQFLEGVLYELKMRFTQRASQAT